MTQLALSIVSHGSTAFIFCSSHFSSQATGVAHSCFVAYIETHLALSSASHGSSPSLILLSRLILYMVYDFSHVFAFEIVCLGSVVDMEGWELVRFFQSLFAHPARGVSGVWVFGTRRGDPGWPRAAWGSRGWVRAVLVWAGGVPFALDLIWAPPVESRCLFLVSCLFVFPFAPPVTPCDVLR